MANLSYTPKIHSLLVHALEQMKRCQGIGDMLEDDVEHIHQMAARTEMHTSRMPNKAHRQFIHSEIEANDYFIDMVVDTYLIIAIHDLKKSKDEDEGKRNES